ncbi:hypothetical protein N2152v2_009129 [Parachlorella kessleri]
MACTVSYAPLPSIVLQCGQCRLICGDTTELVASVACGDLRLVVLRAATDVTVDRASVRAAGEPDPGGCFFNVCCTGCGSALGRLYTEAAAGLECLLNNFSFIASNYELGTSEIRVASATEAGDAGAASAATPAGTARALAGAEAVVAELAARVELLEAELTKMQGMVLLHEAQLRQLPAHPEQQQQQQAGLRHNHGATPGYQRQQPQAPPGAELLTRGSLQQYERHLRTSMGGIG